MVQDVFHQQYVVNLLPFLFTPLKTNMEPKNGCLVQMIFLYNWVIFWFHDNFPGCCFFFDMLKIIDMILKCMYIQTRHSSSDVLNEW